MLHKRFIVWTKSRQSKDGLMVTVLETAQQVARIKKVSTVVKEETVFCEVERYPDTVNLTYFCPNGKKAGSARFSAPEKEPSLIRDDVKSMLEKEELPGIEGGDYIVHITIEIVGKDPIQFILYPEHSYTFMKKEAC